MLKGGGAVEISGPGGVTSYETFTCCHCNRICRVPPPDSPLMGYCGRCHMRECVPCAQKLNGRCLPFERKLEQYEAKQRMLAAITG